jgi:hypothetical protein
MKRILFFLMSICCAMTFFACSPNGSESTGNGDSSQIEQGSNDTSSDSSDDTSDGSSDDSSNDSSNNSSDSSDENDGVWTPPAKQ